jgi:hypothetical protein
MEACVETEVASGAWKALCAGVLLQAVRRVESLRRGEHALSFTINRAGGNCKEHISQKKEAVEWLKGGVGEITFEDCCDALQIDSSRARKLIERHCLNSRTGRRGSTWRRARRK